jgi:hypothetical protein
MLGLIDRRGAPNAEMVMPFWVMKAFDSYYPVATLPFQSIATKPPQIDRN